MKINEKICLIRHLKKLSQEEMAEKLQLSVNGYADIERGKTDVQMSRLEQIAKALDVDIYELFNFAEKNVIFLTVENNPFSSNFIIGQNINHSKEADFEIKKLQLMFEHSQLTIEQKDKEIAGLKEIIELMKNKSA